MYRIQLDLSAGPRDGIAHVSVIDTSFNGQMVVGTYRDLPSVGRYHLYRPELCPAVLGVTTFDWAIPQGYFDAVYRETGERPFTIWVYRTTGGIDTVVGFPLERNFLWQLLDRAVVSLLAAREVGALGDGPYELWTLFPWIHREIAQKFKEWIDAD